MSDISHALAAKSDQLNAVDIMGNDLVIRIREVRVSKADQQPVWIYFDGDNGRPWKPSKGMLRILAAAWGTESVNWVGKYAQLFMNPTVKYAGVEVGGIQIRALSDIDNNMNFVLTLNRKSRQQFPVQKLVIKETFYPDDKFIENHKTMIEYMQTGKMSLQQVIAQCQKIGTLTDQQLEVLQRNAPTQIEDGEEIQ